MQSYLFKCMVCGLAIYLSTSTALAQRVEITLQQAKAYAIEHNRTVANARIATTESKYKLREAIANGLPQAEVKADYSNFLGASANFMGNTIDFNPTSNAQLTVSQLLFSGNYIVGVQLANLAKQLSHTSQVKSELDLAAEVTNAYYMALVAQKSHELAGMNLTNLQSILETTQLSAQVGVIEQTEADQLWVQVNMVENSLKQAERQIELAYNLLRLHLGATAESELILTDGLDKVIAEINLSQLLNTSFAIDNNIDYRMMLQQENMVNKQVNLQRAAALPTLVAFYSYTEKILKPNFDIQPNQMIGLNLTIPIFSSGLRISKVKQARLQHQTIQNQRHLLAEQLSIQEKQARFNLNNASEQYANQQKNIEVAKRVFDNTHLKFQQGVASGIELTTANNNFVSAQNGYIMAVLQLLQAQTELAKLNGKI